MRKLNLLSIGLSILVLLNLFSATAKCQTCDTLSNWETIVQDWFFSIPDPKVIANPNPDAINSSQHCLKVYSWTGNYTYMSTDLNEPVNFDSIAIYRVKIYFSSYEYGDVTIRFENSDNTSFQEIRKSVLYNWKWNDMEFNFSGLESNNLTRMVISWHFVGSAGGWSFYIDDIIRGCSSSTTGTADLQDQSVEINIFELNNQIHIRCNTPELLPPNMYLLNMSGQNLGTFNLEKNFENIINHNLRSGIYLIVMNTLVKPQVHRVIVIN